MPRFSAYSLRHLAVLVAGRRRGLVDVQHVHHRLGGDELQALEDRPLLVGELGLARGLAVAQRVQSFLDHGRLDAPLPCRRPWPRFSRLGRRFSRRVEVGQHQFGLDDLGVAHRVDVARDMCHVAVLEAAQHMGDGVDLADIGQELVAQALALGGALHQAGDVDELELGVDDLGRGRDGRELVEPRIGHGDAADIGLDGAERIVGRLRRLGGGERIEQGRLADIGQADDSTVETHLTLSDSSARWFWRRREMRHAAHITFVGLGAAFGQQRRFFGQRA